MHIATPSSRGVARMTLPSPSQMMLLLLLLTASSTPVRAQDAPPEEPPAQDPPPQDPPVDQPPPAQADPAPISTTTEVEPATISTAAESVEPTAAPALTARPDNQWGCSDPPAGNAVPIAAFRIINQSPFDVQLYKVDVNCTEVVMVSIKAPSFIQQSVVANEVYIARRAADPNIVVDGIKITAGLSTWTIAGQSNLGATTTTSISTVPNSISSVLTTNPASDSASGGNGNTGMIIGVVAGVVVLGAVLVAFLIIRRRRAARASSSAAYGPYGDMKLKNLGPGAGTGIMAPGQAASWDSKQGPNPHFRNGVDAYGDFPTQNMHGTAHGRNHYAAAVAQNGAPGTLNQKKKGINFAPDTQFEGNADGNGGGRFGTLGTFGRRKAGGEDEQMQQQQQSEPYGAVGNGAAPGFVVTPATLKKKVAINTSKAARRASLAWWAAPGVEQKRMQQMQQGQQGHQPELPFNDEDDEDTAYPNSNGLDTKGRVGGAGKSNGGVNGNGAANGTGFFQTVSRTVGTLKLGGAGAGSANNFDYYDQTLHHQRQQESNLSFLQEDPSAIPAPSAIGPGARLRVIHAHRAELEDELTVYPADAIILVESYGDGWCLAKCVRSRTRDAENSHVPTDASNVGDCGMIPIACLDIMQKARLSVAVPEEMPERVRRGRSLLRPESVAIFAAAGRDLSKYN
ncbi:hypothetical protein HDU67_007268 [Dinochytrium kinnereticum]|nr:hypothetical protein HDU67_007268 [Dinochytrium kinnereticum]